MSLCLHVLLIPRQSPSFTFLWNPPACGFCSSYVRNPFSVFHQRQLLLRPRFAHSSHTLLDLSIGDLSSYPFGRQLRGPIGLHTQCPSALALFANQLLLFTRQPHLLRGPQHTHSTKSFHPRSVYSSSVHTYTAPSFPSTPYFDPNIIRQRIRPNVSCHDGFASYVSGA